MKTANILNLKLEARFKEFFVIVSRSLDDCGVSVRNEILKQKVLCFAPAVV